jgi:hypothetical protein
MTRASENDEDGRANNPTHRRRHGVLQSTLTRLQTNLDPLSSAP